MEQTGKRQANFELLRIVSIMCIIALHYVVKGGFAAPYGATTDGVTYVAWLITGATLIPVNCYMLISGYFLVSSEWKPRKLLYVFCEILFYSLLVPIALVLTRVIPFSELSLYDWITFIFPIGAEHYWYGRGYLLVYLISPLLIEGIKRLSKKYLQIIIIVFGIIISVEKSIIPINWVTDDDGYGFLWLLLLFVVGAYLRLYPIEWFNKKSRGIIIYALSLAGMFVISVLCHLLSGGEGNIGFYADMLYCHNYLLDFTGAIGLFMFFKNVNIKDGKVSTAILKIAPLTFGVYLLHENMLVRYEWMKWLGSENHIGKWTFIPHMLMCIIVVFIVGAVVDYGRLWLFGLFSKKK